MTTPEGRTPHPESPAEGERLPDEQGLEGRTPHAEDPAEGVERPPADGSETEPM
jgi:hypothetical protein